MRLGRKNKKYYKDLHQQAYDRLTGMQAFGESKKEAVKNGTDGQKIFSFNTYQSYWKHTKYFLAYIKQKHPEYHNYDIRTCIAMGNRMGGACVSKVGCLSGYLTEEQLLREFQASNSSC